MKIIVDIAGRFTIADQTPEYLAVGFIGSAWADRLPPAQLNHVRGFYGMTGKRTEVWPSYPVKLNRAHMGQSRLFRRLPDNHDREEQDKQNNQAGGTSLKRGRIKQIFPVGLICVIPGGYKLRRLFFGAAKVGDLQSADAIKRKFEVFPEIGKSGV